MKIAFVVGFFEPVRQALRARYPDDAYRNRLIWIESHKRAITVFRERFYDVVKTASGLLVCLGRSGSERHLEDAIQGIVSVGASQFSTPIQFEVFGNQFEAAPLVELVETFGLDAETEIGVGQVRAKVGNRKILCVSLQGKTPICAALRRAGVSGEAISTCFHEEVQKSGKNSNLMQNLKSRSASYCCLLYAWDGLRTSDEDVKDSYAFRPIEARTAAEVAELFKKWFSEK